jgi:DNA-binding MarR family transcriptional regulator
MSNQQDIFALLHSVMKRMRKLAEKELYSFGITSTEMRVLVVLYLLHPEGCAQDIIVSQLDIDRSNVGRALKKLERLNYIHREKNEKDGRAYRVSLTDSGRDIRDQILQIRSNIKEVFLKRFSDQELDTFINLLMRANQDLSHDNYIFD